ncbi:MFS transporter [Thermithiobacillus tepidarius]|uniref:MFS transporter n=2 Tax=Thermithiobacillus tepidarius TaxID=929 RepID=UPI0003FA79CC|nr:MFS transporter [Thermithiobacillus tepidarius]
MNFLLQARAAASDPALRQASKESAMRTRLPRTVVILGLVSFFNDLASEMVVPLIPLLLVSGLQGGPVALGLIEGVAEAVASWLKLWSGRRSDWLGGRRKGLALAGYGLSNLVRPLFGLAGAWPVLLLLRSADRVGKGLRSAPRDALVADSAPPQIMGYAYGYHRALDNGGAVLGSLAAAAVIYWAALPLPQVIALSALPGLLAVLLLAFGIRETARASQQAARPPIPKLRWSCLSRPMRRYLLILGFFTLARASETFILLRAHELGLGVVAALLLWALLNFAKAATGQWGGGLADRWGRPPVMLLGWAAFALSFLAFGQVQQAWSLCLTTLLYGLFTGMSEGAERALVSDFARESERGTAFGWYHLMTGVAAIPAGLLFGLVWQARGAPAAFSLAGVLAALAAILFWLHLSGPASRVAVRRGGL